MGKKAHRILWIAFILLIFAVYDAYALDAPVTDNAGIIDAEYEAQITDVLRQMYDSGTAQMAVVTVKSLEAKDIQSYALELAQGKLGETEKNNGLLLLVSLEDRSYRFEVGRGLEPILNDAKIGRIGRQYLIDNLRNEAYGKGIFESVLAVQSIVGGDTNSPYYVEDADASAVFWSVFAFIIFIMVALSFLKSKGKKYRHDNHYFLAGMMLGSMMGKGRGGMGGFGGGFGGFGGGGFGGGGAGGRW